MNNQNKVILPRNVSCDTFLGMGLLEVVQHQTIFKKILVKSRGPSSP